MWPWLIVPIVLLALIALGLLGRWLHLFSREVSAGRACELFHLQRERLEAHFLDAANRTGKPRGLRWVDCEWEDGVIFVRDRQAGHIAALVAVTIKFEAIPGGDMEDVPAVADKKNASAVFFFQAGHWHTVGKAVFNMNPGEAVEHFRNQYERLA